MGQSSFWNNTRAAVADSLQWTNKWGRGLLLVISFLISFAVILLVSAAQEFQAHMKAAGSNTVYPVGYVLSELEDFQRLVILLRAARTTFSDDEARLTSLRQAADPVIKGASEARSRAENAVLNLCTRYAPTAHPVFEAGFSSANLSTSESQIRTALRDLPAQAHDEPLYKQVGIAMEELVQGRSQLAYLERQIQIAVSEITSAQERLNKADKDLTGTKPFDDQSFRQLVDDLYEYQQFFLGVPFFFVKFPGIMLTLLLTVFMGILGSLIALTRELVFDDEEYTVGTYLFRIALGAGVALAVFFFAGAGVLTLAQTTNGDASHVELGPYLVSFFGIVSGYLSKRVTLWMREVGGNVFRLKGEPDRWGFNLPVALSASGESAETMARAIGATNEQVKFWLDGVKAAPQDIQERIAAFLRKPKHELFTDVAP